MFLLSMEERDSVHFHLVEMPLYALTDYGIQQVGESALPYLKNGDYYGAFDAFLDALPTYFSAYSDGYSHRRVPQPPPAITTTAIRKTWSIMSSPGT